MGKESPGNSVIGWQLPHSKWRGATDEMGPCRSWERRFHGRFLFKVDRRLGPREGFQSKVGKISVQKIHRGSYLEMSLKIVLTPPSLLPWECQDPESSYMGKWLVTHCPSYLTGNLMSSQGAPLREQDQMAGGVVWLSGSRPCTFTGVGRANTYRRAGLV